MTATSTVRRYSSLDGSLRSLSPRVNSVVHSGGGVLRSATAPRSVAPAARIAARSNGTRASDSPATPARSTRSPRTSPIRSTIFAATARQSVDSVCASAIVGRINASSENAEPRKRDENLALLTLLSIPGSAESGAEYTKPSNSGPRQLSTVGTTDLTVGTLRAATIRLSCIVALSGCRFEPRSYVIDVGG